MQETPRINTSELADEVADLMRSLRASVEAAQGLADHPSPTCRACPVCRLLELVRAARPEVLDHLERAWTELGAAARELLVAVPEPGVGSPASTDPTADGRTAGPSAADRAESGDAAPGPEPDPPRAETIPIA